jgi:hypothetical protein
MGKRSVDAGRRSRDSSAYPDVVVEMAVYTDSQYIERYLPKDAAKRIEVIILKYNGVRKMSGRKTSGTIQCLENDLLKFLKYIWFQNRVQLLR